MASETANEGLIETESLTGLHWLAVALAAVTGVVHLVFGIRATQTAFQVSFLLAGLGFFGAIVLFLLDYRRRLLYLVGVPFTAIQIVLYFVLNWPNVLSPGGIGDKIVQTALIVALVVLYRRE